MIRARLLVLALVTVGCTTPTSSSTTSAASAAAATSSRATLAAFASTLSHTGMSVGAPPRVCVPGVDDVSAPASCAPEWNDDVGCVVTSPAQECGQAGADERAVLLPYSRELVRAHVKRPEDDGRGDALVDAWLRHDDARLRALALSVEADFDSARSKTKPTSGSKTAHTKPKPVEKKADVADAGVAEVSSSSVGGGPAENGHVDEGDAGPGGLSIKDRIVGTWIGDDGTLRNIYALCDTGDYVVRYEMTDDSLSEFAGSMPVVHGKWAAHEGDPPTLDLSALGENMTATIITLTDDALEISLEGDNTKLSRRSKSASCD